MSDITSSKRLFQVNTRVLLTDLSRQLGKKATLSDIPDLFFKFLENKFDFVYFLGVWQTGPLSRQVSREHPGLQEEYAKYLEDFTNEQDVPGSMFAVQDYGLHSDFGGDIQKEGTEDDQLMQLRDRLHDHHLKLILDFVPNHTGLDHKWAKEKPAMYVTATPEQQQQQPQNFIQIGDQIYAFGKDPFFDGWTDTLQLNYRHPECRDEMLKQLLRISKYADGLRCDMAMLLLEDVVQSCWGNFPLFGGIPEVTKSFWLDAIPAVKKEYPDILFIAESYWDKEWILQKQGFDYTYDKKLYDRLITADPSSVRGHLTADLSFQYHSVRFLENHDEPRAASVFSNLDQHKAAAIITYLVPGLRFFHDGQLDGRKFKLPVQMSRRHEEEPDLKIQEFYFTLLNNVLNRPELARGHYKLLDCKQVSDEDDSARNFISFAWTYSDPLSPSSPSTTATTTATTASTPDAEFPRSPRRRGSGVYIGSENSASESEELKFLLTAVNYSASPSKCFVDMMPFGKILFNHKFAVHDIIQPQKFFIRDGNDLAHQGLYLDVEPWGAHVFEIRLFHVSA